MDHGQESYGLTIKKTMEAEKAYLKIRLWLQCSTITELEMRIERIWREVEGNKIDEVEKGGSRARNLEIDGEILQYS